MDHSSGIRRLKASSWVAISVAIWFLRWGSELLTELPFINSLHLQFPGALIAEKFSAKWVMFASVCINVVCTLLTPLAAEIGVWTVVLMRVLEGLGGGVTFPAEHTMISAWAPPAERSTISSIIYAGTALGTVISMLMAGMLAEWYGWASIFYVMGGLSCIWMVLWIWLVQDTPMQQPLMDQAERDYIVRSLNSGGGQKHTKRAIPWKAIFTSKPFFGILIAHTCNNWGWYMLLIELPIYMNMVLKFQIKENAVYTAVPFLTLWFFSIFISKTLDTLRSKNIISTTTARKIATLIASFVPMCCLLALCYIGCNKMAAVFIAGLAVTSIGAMFSGFLSNHIDLAPNFAGILMAFTNTVATIPGITVPLFVGTLVHSDVSLGQLPEFHFSFSWFIEFIFSKQSHRGESSSSSPSSSTSSRLSLTWHWLPVSSNLGIHQKTIRLDPKLLHLRLTSSPTTKLTVTLKLSNKDLMDDFTLERVYGFLCFNLALLLQMTRSDFSAGWNNTKRWAWDFKLKNFSMFITKSIRNEAER